VEERDRPRTRPSTQRQDLPALGPVPVPPLPADEESRLRTLTAYRIMDTGRDARFEELVAEVSRVCDAPIATITFIDRDRQWFKASVGLTIDETERDVAFCAYTILEPEETLVVEDTTKDPRFADNPLVLGDPRLMAYAGAPMVAPDGAVVGTVCAMDVEPREYSAEQLAVLRRVAGQVVELLDARSAAQRLLDGAVDATTDELEDATAHVAHGRSGTADEVLSLTRPLIEAIGEDVDIVEVLERFCAETLETFGWWAARVCWVQGDTLRPDPWQLLAAAPASLRGLAASIPAPLVLDDLNVHYADPAVHDVGMLRWMGDRDVVAGAGGRQVIVLDVPGATSLAARLVFLVPSARALGPNALRTLATASAVLPRVFVQDRARKELTYRATHDLLTGLLNREGLERRYRTSGSDGAVARAVLYLDLDGFKRINDTLGHRAGDEVLVHVARQLNGRIRPTDTAARLGGDEFLLILEGIAHEDEALRVARRLLRALCGTFTVLQTERVQVAVSIGVALLDRADGFEAALDAADALMFAAKELGGSHIAVEGLEGRRLIGASAGEVRDLDAALTGALQVRIAPIVHADGRPFGLRVGIVAEIRNPGVEDLVALVDGGIQAYLGSSDARLGLGSEQAAGHAGGLACLAVSPAPLLWAAEGVVLRMVVALRRRYPGLELHLVLESSDDDEPAVSQAIEIRDALGIGLAVAGFGASGRELQLVDLVDPRAIELAEDVVAAHRPGDPVPSAMVAATALAERRGLRVIAPSSGGADPAAVAAGCACDLVVDLSALQVHSAAASSRPSGGRPLEQGELDEVVDTTDAGGRA
jgi:diguanylate cyclase (GGDEF)-like protein